MTAPSPMLIGWAKCVTGRDELIAVTVEQCDALQNAALPCPACGKQCGPGFELVQTSADVTLLSWRDGRWGSGFALKGR